MYNMDQSYMLENHLKRPLENLQFFLNSSESNFPQKITDNFASTLSELVDEAIENNRKDHAVILLRSVHYLLRQDQRNTITTLLTSRVHFMFGKLLRFLTGHYSSKTVSRPHGDQCLTVLLEVTAAYMEKMEDDCAWFIHFMLLPLLTIIADFTAYFNVRTQCLDTLIAVLAELNRNSVTNLRKYVLMEPRIDSLCTHMMQRLTDIGDYQLQETFVEVMFRIWATPIRKQKAPLWCNHNTHLQNRLLAITYDDFDNRVRLFLNSVNNSLTKRRVLTLPYKELQVGEKHIVFAKPDQNWVDFNYESKRMDIYFITPNQGDGQNNRSLSIIQTEQILSYDASRNIAARSIDLNLDFSELTTDILSDLPLTEDCSTNLTIRFWPFEKLDPDKLLHYTIALFGSKRVTPARSSRVSKARNWIKRNTGIPEPDHASPIMFESQPVDNLDNSFYSCINVPSQTAWQSLSQAGTQQQGSSSSQRQSQGYSQMQNQVPSQRLSQLQRDQVQAKDMVPSSQSRSQKVSKSGYMRRYTTTSSDDQTAASHISRPRDASFQSSVRASQKNKSMNSSGLESSGNASYLGLQNKNIRVSKPACNISHTPVSRTSKPVEGFGPPVKHNAAALHKVNDSPVRSNDSAPSQLRTQAKMMEALAVHAARSKVTQADPTPQKRLIQSSTSDERSEPEPFVRLPPRSDGGGAAAEALLPPTSVSTATLTHDLHGQSSGGAEIKKRDSRQSKSAKSPSISMSHGAESFSKVPSHSRAGAASSKFLSHDRNDAAKSPSCSTSHGAESVTKVPSNSRAGAASSKFLSHDPDDAKIRKMIETEVLGHVGEYSRSRLSQKSNRGSMTSMVWSNTNTHESSRDTVSGHGKSSKKAESKTSMVAAKAKLSQRGINDDEDFKNTSSRRSRRSQKEQKPLEEILKESNKDGPQWNEIIPETQRAPEPSLVGPGDVSVDMMLDSLVPELKNQGTEQQEPPKQGSSQKKPDSKKLVTVHLPRRITRSKNKATETQESDDMSPEYPSSVLSGNLKKPTETLEIHEEPDLNDNYAEATLEKEAVRSDVAAGTSEKRQAELAAKVNAEFKSLQAEFADKRTGKAGRAEKEVDEGKEKRPKQKQNKTKPKRATVSAKKKRRSLLNADIAEPLEDLSLNDPTLIELPEKGLRPRSVKKMPYAAKFIKDSDSRKNTTGSDSSTKRTSTKKGQNKEVSVFVEVYKTGTEAESSEVNGNRGHQDMEIDQTSSGSGLPGALKELNINERNHPHKRAAKGVLESTRISGEQKRRSSEKLQMSVIKPPSSLTTLVDSEDVFEIETIREAPAAELEIPHEADTMWSPPAKAREENLQETESSGTSDTVKRAWSSRKLSVVGDPSSGELYQPRQSTLIRTRSTSSSPESPPKPQRSKKKSRVSFDDYDFDLNENEEKQRKKQTTQDKGKATKGKSKRSKKSRLFDSTSDIASISSSELSWVKEQSRIIQDALERGTPKIVKRYGKNQSSRSQKPLDLPPLETIMNKTDTTPKRISSDSSIEQARSEASYCSVASGISRMQSLAEVCNLSFDDIVYKTDGKKSAKIAMNRTAIETDVLHEDTTRPFHTLMETEDQMPENDYTTLPFDVRGDPSMATMLDGNDAKRATEKDDFTTLPFGIGDAGMTTPNINPTKRTEKTSKAATVSVGLSELAEKNNQTPTDNTEKLKTAAKDPSRRKKRKVSEAVELPPRLESESNYHRSKKQLKMDTSSSLHLEQGSDGSSTDVELPRRMIKALGKYVRDVERTLSSGRMQRNKQLEEFQSGVTSFVEKHEDCMRKVRDCQDETKKFISENNRKINSLLSEAASSLMGVKSLHGEMARKQSKTDVMNDAEIENLRLEISLELKEMVKKMG